ncbi:ABC transporter ATP-binding protein [Campylobacter majalis]|uniref:ABC transporter ATP-binding protein n=1 Tax=Campylobacter majalis TaxID=2790656 RepID=UPI003D69287D
MEEIDMLEILNLDYEILSDKIINNFNLKVKPGKIVTLFGPSGCGKTTILRLISEIEIPKRGKIINSFKKTSYLFQENRLLEWLSAYKNIALVAKNEAEILPMLKHVGLSQKDSLKYPDELSGGMRARVSFVRAMLSEPDLLLLDEPFSGLDTDMREILINLVLERVSKGMSVVLVTHDRFEAVKMSDEIYFLTQKGMGVKRILSLDINQHKRDNAYIQHIIDDGFNGEVYYD